MSKKETRKDKDLSISEQFQAIMPEIKKIHNNMALKDRVHAIYSSMGEFSRTYAEELWPTEERTAFTQRLLDEDTEALSELEKMEKRWLD